MTELNAQAENAALRAAEAEIIALRDRVDSTGRGQVIEDCLFLKLKGDPEPRIMRFLEEDNLIDFANHLYDHVKKHGFSGWSRVNGVLINMSEVQMVHPGKNPHPETESEKGE